GRKPVAAQLVRTGVGLAEFQGHCRPAGLPARACQYRRNQRLRHPDLPPRRLPACLFDRTSRPPAASSSHLRGADSIFEQHSGADLRLDGLAPAKGIDPSYHDGTRADRCADRDGPQPHRRSGRNGAHPAAVHGAAALCRDGAHRQDLHAGRRQPRRFAVAQLLAGLSSAQRSGRDQRHCPGIRDGSWLLHHARTAWRIGRHDDCAAHRAASRRFRAVGNCGRARCRIDARGRRDLRVAVSHPCFDGRQMTGGFRAESVWQALRLAVTALLLVFLVAPMIIVVIISFSSAPFLTFPPPGFSMQWYRNLFADGAWADSLTTSVEIVIPTGVLAMTIGTAAALGLARGRIPGKNVIIGLLMSPIVAPVIIVAAAIFGVYRIWNLSGSLTGFILAHTVLTVPYVVSTVLASLQMVDVQYEQAALTLGASPWVA